MFYGFRKNVFFTLLSLAVLGIMSTLANAVTLEEIKDRGSIRVAIANEKPYAYMTEDGMAMGPGPDVTRYVMEELGIGEIEWIVTTFGDLIPGLEENRFDMAAAEMAILPERCEMIIYSEPNTTYGEGLLVKAGNPQGFRYYNDFAKRNEFKVAIMAGANQKENLMKLGVPEDKMLVIENNEDAIEAVTSGKANAYAATSLTVAELAGQSDKVERALDFVDPVIDGKEIRGWGGFAFNQDSTELRDAVNEVLVPYKYSDEWEETLTGYGFSMLDVLNSFKYSTDKLCSKE